MSRVRIGATLLALTLACACGEDDDRPAPTTTDPATSTDEGPRGPHGADAADCSAGASDPPELAELRTVSSAQELEQEIHTFEALVGANPRSALARSRLGELLLRTEPPRADTAKRFFDRALEMHDAGCALEDRDLWAALEGAALSRIIGGDYAGAVPLFRRSLERWPGARPTRYNLACALCQTGDVDGCARELERAIGQAEQPLWLAQQGRDGSHYAGLAQSDPDLAPLRADPARFATVTGGAAP
ncbi:MAG: tetratricopeptide repeat protein [Sandaracinaceae bacterium]